MELLYRLVKRPLTFIYKVVALGALWRREKIKPPNNLKKFKHSNLFIASTENGQIGTSIFIPVNREDLPNLKCFIFCHGTNSTREQYNWMFENEEPFIDNDIMAITFDYREFGDSKGYFNVVNCCNDLNVIIKFAHDLGVNNIILLGHSLGCGIILECVKYLQEKLDYNKIILVAPFTNLLDASKSNVIFRLLDKIFPLSRIVKDSFLFDNVNNIKYANITNVMILNAYDDEKFGKNASLGNKLENVTNIKTNHNGIMESKEAWNEIMNFIK